MRRFGEEGGEPPLKRQATLANFFKRSDGEPLSNVPAFVPDQLSVQCPYCELVITSLHSSALPGALKAHVAYKHQFELLEASARASSAVEFINRSIFDFVPMETIGEEPDDMDVVESSDTVEKSKKLRHSYTLKDKFKTVKALDDAETQLKAKLGPDKAYFVVSLHEIVSSRTGVPMRTLRDWIEKKDEIRKLYLEQKRARKVRKFGCGRKPLFPKAEGIVASIVKDRRKNCKLVSKAFILKNLKIEAEKENRDLFLRTKFSPELVAGFMRRSRFSLRYPSCIRTDNLDESILICRAFHRDLFRILSDSGDVKYAKSLLDPSFGRFLLKYRFNGDEVPYRFGRVKSIVSITGENATQVTWPPGWEARLATLFLLMNGEGAFAGKIVVIFQGSFDSPSKKRREEVKDYSQKYPNVFVLFQKKAWMDGPVLARITTDVLLPHVRHLWAGDGLEFAESLLQLDNGPGRNDEKFLNSLSKDCRAFLLKSPPNQTGFIQLIDDNCGRIYRDLACDVIEEEVLAMSAAEIAALTNVRKREMMVRAAEKAYNIWMDPTNDKYRKIGQRAALRTGLAMRVDDNCKGVQPVRFPETYPSSIPPSSGAPVRAYFTTNEPPPPVLTASLPSNGTVSHLEVTGVSPVTIVRIDTTPRLDTTVRIRVDNGPAQSSRRTYEEVGIFDGWSDEEERVFLDDEVDGSDSSSDDEEPSPRRITKRKRWCLAGCDCERPIGSRKCMCEKTASTFCGKNCACDPQKCRSREKEGENDED